MQEISQDATLIMGSSITNAFVTYKRKRLLSRSDLHSDTHPEISVSKFSANFEKHENRISGHILQNEETCHEYSQRKAEENALQCENCDSQHQDQCSEEHAPKLQRLYSACSEQQDFSISKCNGWKQEGWSQNSDGKQGTFHPTDVEEKSFNAQSNQFFVNSDSEQNCEEEVRTLASPDACSVRESDILCCSRHMDTCISGPSTYEEMNKLNENQPSSLCNNSDTKDKWRGNLITYYRKSKRKRNVSSEYPGATSASKTRLSGSALTALKEWKKPQEDANNSRTSPVSAMEIALSVHMDGPFCYQETAKRTPGATSLDIDCNLPPVSGFEENHLPGSSVVPPDLPGLTSKRNEHVQTIQAQCRDNDSQAMVAVGDKGKSIMESSSASTGISSKNKYLQLFPENSSGDTSQLPNGREKLRLNGKACYNSPAAGPNGVQLHLRETFHDFLAPAPDQMQSFARQRMMLDNILTRARAARGNRTILPDTFQPPTVWSEAELDCLWIGVRRHGRGNWDTILQDRRLQFSPWKMPRDLAEKWQEEQSRVFQTTHFSQVRYANLSPNLNPFPPGHVSSLLMPHANGNGPVDEVQLSLGNPYGCGGVPNGHFYHLMNIQNNLVRNSGALSSHGYFNPSNFHGVHLRDESSLGTGGLPRWLREAVETPLGINPSLLYPGMQWPNHTVGGPRQPLPDKRYASTWRNEPGTNPQLVVSRARNEMPEERNVSEQDGLIIIPSDASSEDTISDDHSNRPS